MVRGQRSGLAIPRGTRDAKRKTTGKFLRALDDHCLFEPGRFPVAQEVDGGTIVNFIFHPGQNVNGSLLGGKAAALAALQNKGLAIPEWFVVLPHAFEAS